MKNSKVVLVISWVKFLIQEMVHNAMLYSVADPGGQSRNLPPPLSPYFPFVLHCV